MKGIDAVDFDDVVVYRNHATSAECYEVWSYRCARCDYTTQWILGIAARMHLQNSSLVGRIITVEPVQHPDFLELIDTEQSRPVLRVHFDAGPTLGFPHPANRAYRVNRSCADFARASMV